MNLHLKDNCSAVWKGDGNMSIKGVPMHSSEEPYPVRYAQHPRRRILGLPTEPVSDLSLTKSDKAISKP